MVDADYVYYLFAREFGWTPKQVDELTTYQANRLMRYIQDDYERAGAPKGPRRGSDEFDEDEEAWMKECRQILAPHYGTTNGRSKR